MVKSQFVANHARLYATSYLYAKDTGNGQKHQKIESNLNKLIFFFKRMMEDGQ